MLVFIFFWLLSPPPRPPHKIRLCACVRAFARRGALDGTRCCQEMQPGVIYRLGSAAAASFLFSESATSAQELRRWKRNGRLDALNGMGTDLNPLLKQVWQRALRNQKRSVKLPASLSRNFFFQWHTFMFLMLFCLNLAWKSHCSEIQLLCDGRTDGPTHPFMEMRERIY